MDTENEEKPVVKVLSDDEKKLVIESANGGEKTYHLNPIRTLWLRVEHAKVVKSASSPDTGLLSMRLSEGKGVPDPAPEPLSELELKVSGTAVLEDRLGIIGEPGKETRSIKIHFSALDEEGSRRRSEQAREYGNPFWPQLATVGFVSADWELGLDDEYYVECEVSPSTLTTLAAAVSSGELHALTLGLSLRNIYTDDPWAPPSVTTNWFLRPSRSDNSWDSPESAFGCVAHLNLELASFRYAPDVSPIHDEEEEAEPATAKVDDFEDRRQAALQALTASIERLRRTVRVVGGFIAFFVLLLAFK